MDTKKSLNSPNSNVNNNETSVANADGSVSITRNRTINDNGTMRTQTGRIKLMPQFETAGGTPVVIGNKVKDQLFGFSENKGGVEVEIFSGTRTKAQNDILVKKGTGAKRSAHLSSDAADIGIKNISGSQIATAAYHSNLFDRVNIYSNGGVHVDNKPRPQGSMGFYRDWQRVGNVTPGNKPTPPAKKR